MLIIIFYQISSRKYVAYPKMCKTNPFLTHRKRTHSSFELYNTERYTAYGKKACQIGNHLDWT